MNRFRGWESEEVFYERDLERYLYVGVVFGDEGV